MKRRVRAAPEWTSPPQPDPRPEFYTVKKGDTLYTIALDHGLDYKELATLNSIVFGPSTISFQSPWRTARWRRVGSV